MYTKEPNVENINMSGNNANLPVIGSYRIANSNDKIEIPCSVAVCPYCGTKLTIEADGWTEDEANPDYWIADMPSNVWCETEPDIEDETWEEWFSSHSEMPYIYMLPAQSKIEEWLKQNYRWKL